jgi:hypothetical protein
MVHWIHNVSQPPTSRSSASTRMSAPLRGSFSPKRDWKFPTGRRLARSCICCADSSVSVNTDPLTPDCSEGERKEARGELLGIRQNVLVP